MKNPNIIAAISILLVSYILTGCSSDNDQDDTANKIVACRLDDFNQCFEWINLTDAMVDSLSATCVNDDNGIIVEACSTENLIGICEQIDDPPTPDLLNYFYLSPTTSDPVAYANQREQGCIDAGGNWTPVN